MAQYRLCFLDLETTGHDPLKRVGETLILWHEIIEMGALIVDFRSLEILSEFEIKVSPKHPERCLPNLVNDYITRAQNGEWDHAYLLSAAISQFLYFCREYEGVNVLIGQNFSFDWAFLNAAFTWCGIMESEWRKIFHYGRLDTRSMAVQELIGSNDYNPDDYSLRNERLSKLLGIEKEAYPRQALSGARQSYMIYKKLRECHYLDL